MFVFKAPDALWMHNRLGINKSNVMLVSVRQVLQGGGLQPGHREIRSQSFHLQSPAL